MNNVHATNHELEKKFGVELVRQLKENQKRFFWLGVLLIILGTLAVMFSTISTEIFIVYFGLFLIILGFSESVRAFNMHLWRGFFAMHLFLGVLFSLAGIFMLLNPLENAIMLTLFWSVFFMFSGLVRIITAFTHHVPHQGLLVFGGIINVLLGAIVFLQWPVSGTWVIGLFVGIDVLIAGWSLVMLSSMIKQVEKLKN